MIGTMNAEEMQFSEYLYGGPLPVDREHWIALKAGIELASIQAFEQAERQLCGYYGNNELAMIATF